MNRQLANDDRLSSILRREIRRLADEHKRFRGLVHAEPIKRYRSFVTEACDTEDVWMHRAASGQISVWAEECFGEVLYDSSELIHIDVHDFISVLKDAGAGVLINVFPTEGSSYMVDKDKLLNYIVEELNRVE